jgi:hypothetical protein
MRRLKGLEESRPHFVAGGKGRELGVGEQGK